MKADLVPAKGILALFDPILNIALKQRLAVGH